MLWKNGILPKIAKYLITTSNAGEEHDYPDRNDRQKQQRLSNLQISPSPVYVRIREELSMHDPMDIQTVVTSFGDEERSSFARQIQVEEEVVCMALHR
jgi:hypothetical protein